MVSTALSLKTIDQRPKTSIPETRPRPEVRSNQSEHYDTGTRLDRTIENARVAILSRADESGAWQTPYNLGVVPGLIASIAAHFAGQTHGDFLQKDKAIFVDAVASQGEDGSFKVYEGGPKTKQQSRLFAVAAEYALKKNPEIRKDPVLAENLKTAVEKARKFQRSDQPSCESFIFTSMVNLVDDLTSPGKELTSKFSPLRPGLVKLMLHNKLGKTVTRQLMAPMPGILPAMAILNKQTGERAKPTLLTNITGRTGPLSRAREKTVEQMEKDVLEWQDSNGGWVYTAVATAVSVMALKSRGYDVQSPEVRNGLDYLETARFDTEHGQRISFLDASVWDTAVAGDVLLATGMRGDDPVMNGAIDRLLESQHEDGRWAFALKSEHIPDSDDAAMAIRFLTRALPTARPEKRTKIREAIERGWMLV